MSTETENTSCNSLAEHCALNGIKRTSIFTGVKEAIASMLGSNDMDPKLQGILSETAQKHTEIMESNSLPSEEMPESANDANFDESVEKAA